MPDDARTMIVTGASSGIGRALALAAAREGFRVVLVARRAERLEEVARAIRAGGGACAVVAGDVTRARRWPDRIVGAALRAFGRIDVVVNNAGAGAYRPAARADRRRDRGAVAAPRRGAAASRARRAPVSEATRGQLVFVGSGVARVPLPYYGAYALAKAAIRAAAIQLRRELRARRHRGHIRRSRGGRHRVSRRDRHRARAATGRAAPERVARAMLRGIARRARRRQRRAMADGVHGGRRMVGDAGRSDRHALRRVRARRRSTLRSAGDAELPKRSPQPRNDRLREGAGAGRAAHGTRQAVAELHSRRARAGATLELNELAMRWAGMPNKNERAALREVLDALAAGGYLEQTEEETWRVVRAAD